MNECPDCGSYRMSEFRQFGTALHFYICSDCGAVFQSERDDWRARPVMQPKPFRVGE